MGRLSGFKYHEVARRLRKFGYAIVAMAVGLAFANCMLNGWTYDDHSVIAGNPIVRHFSNIGILFSPDYFLKANEGSWRPVVTASYFFDAAIWGIRPAGAHLTNYLLHLGAALLLFGQLRRMGIGEAPALAGALLFGLHPVVCEPVNGVGFREDLLVGFFGLLAWRFFSLHASARLFPCLCGGLCIFWAQLSKESAVAWPLLFLCLGFKFRPDSVSLWSRSAASPNEPGRPAPKINRASLTALICALVPLTLALLLQLVLFANPSHQEIPWPRGARLASWFGAPFLVLRYLGLILFPWHLSPDYPTLPAPDSLPAFVAGGGGLGLLLLGLTIGLLWRRSRFAGGWLLFLLPLAPVTGVVPVAQPFTERFLYVPMMGIAWMAAEALEIMAQRAREGRLSARAVRIVVGACITVLVALGARAVVRNRDWKDNETLFIPVLESNPASTRGLQARGNRLVGAKQYEQAAEVFRKIIAQKPDESPEAYYQLGYVLGELARNEEAAEASHQATILWPEYPDAHLNAAIYYLRMIPPDKEKAAEHLRAYRHLGFQPPAKLLREAGL
ncbi:MAG: tetratricopeptide repeat protein [Candidatus Sumerlaeota bacterium]|nr:tetratricopeptide repeat protein [Candidatus Sumerlaeota bacterium]